MATGAAMQSMYFQAKPKSMSVTIAIRNCFLIGECLTNGNFQSDCDLSIPFSQFATHSDFVNNVDNLMSNDLSLLHCNNDNGLLFHMTQPTSRSTIKAIACSKPTISEN